MEKIANRLIGVGTFITGTYIGLKSFTFTVDGGQRGLIFDRFAGLKTKIYGEGIHFFLPVLQSPIIQEIRLQAKSVASMTGTKDQQTVDIAIRMLHKPIEEHLAEIYKTIGLNYEEKILPSIANEVLKSVVAQYDADQLIKMREKISQEVKDGLTARAKDFKIILEDVSIIHLGFMKEYAQAIEQKQVAQQLAERQKFIVDKDEQEKNAKILLSEGEAEAARLINDAVKQFGGAQIEIKRLEAAKIIAEVMAKSPNVTWVPTGQGIGNLLNLKT